MKPHYRAAYPCQSAQVLAIVASPIGRPRRFINCDVHIVFQNEIGGITAVCEEFLQVGGFGCLSGYQMDVTGEMDQYWHRKVQLVKGAEAVSLRQTRRDLVNLSIECVKRNTGSDDVKLAEGALIRFDRVISIDPWLTNIVMKFRDPHDGSVSGFRIWEQLMGNSISEVIWPHYKPMVAALPVLPFRYFSHYGKRRWEKMETAHRGINDAQYEVREQVFRIQSIPKKMTWQGVRAAVERAVRRGKTSTAAARAWFEKQNLLSRFTGWAATNDTTKTHT